MKKLLVSVAAAAIACSAPASAASFEVTSLYSSPIAVPGVNDFKSDLAGLGYVGELIGASVKVIGGGWVSFEFLGSESGFFDTFSFAGNPLYSESSTGVINNFASPALLQGFYVADGASFDVLFTNNAGAGGRSATPGEEGFAVFLKSIASDQSVYNMSELVFGYDDQANEADDNHDDMIIRATISPVPEPATWAMMVGGIAAVGFAMRRRPQTARVSFS